MKKGILKDTAWGVGPLGGNAVEGTGTPNAPVRDTATQGVPLFYDARVGQFISELAIEELDDQDISLRKSKRYIRDEQWRAKAGFTKS